MFTPGDRIGPYRIERSLGQGGMASVYLAEDTAVGRVVALKVLEQSAADAEGRARFVREAQALGRIDHDNVVKVFAAGQTDGHAWMSLEYVDGDPLDALLVAGPLDEESTFTLLAQVARGLKAVHDAGVVHRDVKPQNLLLDAQGVVRIADFGIAALLARVTGGFATQAGVAVGTPHFMAPEQARGEAATAQTDAWGLGCTAFMLLTGRPPFFVDDDESDAVILARVLHEDVPDIATLCPDLTPGAVDALKALLSKDAVARPADLDAFADRLEDVLDADPAFTDSARSADARGHENDVSVSTPPPQPAPAHDDGAAVRSPPRAPVGVFAAVATAVLVFGALMFWVLKDLQIPDDNALGSDGDGSADLRGLGADTMTTQQKTPGADRSKGLAPLRLVADDELVLKKPRLNEVLAPLGSVAEDQPNKLTDAFMSEARQGKRNAIEMLVALKDPASQTAVVTLAQEDRAGPAILAEIAKQRALHHFAALEAASKDVDPAIARAALESAQTLRTVTAHTLLTQMSKAHPDEQIRAAASRAQKAIFSVAAD